ncbi:hypothetical protein [Pseudarthrobacter sp. MDT1-22]
MNLTRSSIIRIAAAAACLALASCSGAAPKESAISKGTSAPPSQGAELLEAYTVLANGGDGPQVTEVSVREGRNAAAVFCNDLGTKGRTQAERALSLRVSELDGVYIKMFAAETVCSNIFGPTATATPKS